MTRPPLHAYQAYHGLHAGSRLILSEHDDREQAQASGAFLVANPEAVVEVRP